MKLYDFITGIIIASIAISAGLLTALVLWLMAVWPR